MTQDEAKRRALEKFGPQGDALVRRRQYEVGVWRGAHFVPRAASAASWSAAFAKLHGGEAAIPPGS